MELILPLVLYGCKTLSATLQGRIQIEDV